MLDNHEINIPLKVESVGYNNPYDFSRIHRHSYFELMFFDHATGEGINTIDFYEYPINKFSLHIVYPNQVHLMKRTSEDNGLIVQFTKEYLMTGPVNFQPEWLYLLQTNPVKDLNKEQFEKLFRIFSHLKDLTKQEAVFRSLIIRHYFQYAMFNLLEMLNDGLSVRSGNLALNFMLLAETHFREKRTVSDYADMLNVSVKKLNKEVKAGLGKPPLQLLHDLRAIEIKRLMLTGDHSHKEISYLLHFDSQASYTRFVNRYFEMSPSMLKQSLQSSV
ncbi:MAG: helix-turn-helix transcriptional regulator [Bacteroidota bacterium]